MVYEDIFPQYLAMNVPREIFMDSCPKELEPYEAAYKMRRNEEDLKQWQLGQYIGEAMGCLLKGKYPKEPMFQMKENIKHNSHKESQEEVAVFEMKQRINLLRQNGLPESPM